MNYINNKIATGIIRANFYKIKDLSSFFIKAFFWKNKIKNPENATYLINAYLSNTELDEIFRNLKESGVIEIRWISIHDNCSDILAQKLPVSLLTIMIQILLCGKVSNQ